MTDVNDKSLIDTVLENLKVNTKIAPQKKTADGVFFVVPKRGRPNQVRVIEYGTNRWVELQFNGWVLTLTDDGQYLVSKVAKA